MTIWRRIFGGGKKSYKLPLPINEDLMKEQLTSYFGDYYKNNPEVYETAYRESPTNRLMIEKEYNDKLLNNKTLLDVNEVSAPTELLDVKGIPSTSVDPLKLKQPPLEEETVQQTPVLTYKKARAKSKNTVVSTTALNTASNASYETAYQKLRRENPQEYAALQSVIDNIKQLMRGAGKNDYFVYNGLYYTLSPDNRIVYLGTEINNNGNGYTGNVNKVIKTHSDFSEYFAPFVKGKTSTSPYRNYSITRVSNSNNTDLSKHYVYVQSKKTKPFKTQVTSYKPYINNSKGYVK